MQNKASEDGTMMSFREISTYLRSHKDIVEGELYVGSDHIVALDSAPFFRLIPNNPHNVSFDAARLVLIRKGSCDITIGPMKFNCRPGDIVFINSGVVINDDEVDKNTKLEGFAVSKSLLIKSFGGRLPELLLAPDMCFCVHPNSKERHVLKQIFHTLYLLSQLSEATNESICSLIVSAYCFVEALHKQNFNLDGMYKSRNKLVAEQFIRLVNNHAKHQHELEFYASKLCLTPHYLGMIVKRETNITAKEWIDNTLIVQIQSELKYTNNSLKVIASDFDFISLSAFCKFYKRKTGHTARSYRMKRNE